MGGRTLAFSLEELKRKYKPVTITTTIQCAGNRRAEMSEFKSVKGLSWGTCAIGTARWTGVRFDFVVAIALSKLDSSFDMLSVVMRKSLLEICPICLENSTCASTIT